MATHPIDQIKDVTDADEFPPLFANELDLDLKPSRYFRTKRILDSVVAAVLLVPGLLMVLVLVILVRITSRGPCIFRQTRVGQNGRIFSMYKIRTMVCDAEADTGPTWSTDGDPRTTRVGRVLRKMHLDELPQLMNVIKGEMSLVGPRPERPEIIQSLVDEIPGYLNRLAVPAGITGLAQINLPPDTDLDDVRRKLVLDLKYIRSAGLWLDLRIIMFSGARILRIPAGLARIVLGLKREQVTSNHQYDESESECEISARLISQLAESVKN